MVAHYFLRNVTTNSCLKICNFFCTNSFPTCPTTEQKRKETNDLDDIERQLFKAHLPKCTKGHKYQRDALKSRSPTPELPKAGMQPTICQSVKNIPQRKTG